MWLAALSATFVANLVGILTIATAIALSERRIELRKLSQVLKFGLTVGITNTIVVLAAVTFLWRDPEMLWILALPAVLLYLAYRAYMSEREKHESLEFLYESTTILQRTPELDTAIVQLLGSRSQDVPRRDRRADADAGRRDARGAPNEARPGRRIARHGDDPRGGPGRGVGATAGGRLRLSRPALRLRGGGHAGQCRLRGPRRARRAAARRPQHARLDGRGQPPRRRHDFR